MGFFRRELNLNLKVEQCLYDSTLYPNFHHDNHLIIDYLHMIACTVSYFQIPY